jgi:hypothetical protein
MRRHRCLKGVRQMGFSATVSIRALIVECLGLGSFDQCGTKPHLARTISRPACVLRMIWTECEGAML